MGECIEIAKIRNLWLMTIKGHQKFRQMKIGNFSGKGKIWEIFNGVGAEELHDQCRIQWGGHGAMSPPSGQPVIFQHVVYDENNSLIACRSSSKQFKQIVLH